LFGEWSRLILQTPIEEFTAGARVCWDCVKLRRQRDSRTCKVQTLFGAIAVDAPRIKGRSFVDPRSVKRFRSLVTESPHWRRLP
jgi:hypothetical protein